MPNVSFSSCYLQYIICSPRALAFYACTRLAQKGAPDKSLYPPCCPGYLDRHTPFFGDDAAIPRITSLPLTVVEIEYGLFAILAHRQLLSEPVRLALAIVTGSIFKVTSQTS